MLSSPSSHVEDQTDVSGPALWQRFVTAESQDEYCRNWLAYQCSLISNACLGLLILGDPDAESFVPVAQWPPEQGNVDRLVEVSERALAERSGLLTELPPHEGSSARSHYGIAYPILIEQTLHGVVAVEVATGSEAALRGAMGQLQWGVGWLELWHRRSQATDDAHSLARLKSAVDLLAGVLSEARFDGACMAFVTELANLMQCDRVSVGFAKNSQVTVRAVSHSAQFGKRMNLNRAIASAMEEAIVQRHEIQYPAPPDAEVVVTRDHALLARLQGEEAILTVPLYGHERYYGALTLERPAKHPFVDADVEFCRSVSGLAGPALENKRLEDRPLPLKLFDACKIQIERLMGPGYPVRKLVVFALVAIALFLGFARGDYRLSADASLEGAVQRVIAAPFNAYIREAQVRPGDVVSNEMLLCTLDDRDLRLERLRWLSQQRQLQRQLQDARAGHDRAQFSVLGAQLEQVRAELELVEAQLDRTQIRAPFDGVVISGDLSQRLGAAVTQGEVLFEVAPLDAYRVILEVDESRIADVRVDQEGRLLLAAFPNQPFDFAVEKITPISLAREGRNYFRVEAALDQPSAQLRPGMEGVGKVFIDRRKLVSIWTRELVAWLRLWIWSWWP